MRFFYRYRPRWHEQYGPVAIAFTAFVGWIAYASWDSQAPVNPAPVALCAAQPRPSQGEYTASDFSPRVAPFKINTAAGFDYLVKLENVQNNSTSLSFFVYGGEPFETHVPLGVYVLKYAAGTAWCGDKGLFGEKTFAKKGSTLLVFERDYDGYSGQEVILIAQRGGNFRTDYIKPSEF